MPKPAKWDTDYGDLPPGMADDLRAARREISAPSRPKPGLLARLVARLRGRKTR